MPTQPKSDRLASCPPIPHDVKMAIEFMRAAVCRPISMVDLVPHCGVAERTLNKHFRTFLNISPMRYLRRLRLVAAREALLAGEPGISVTEVAKRYEFNHLGRFAEQYRRCFGESPSATHRLGRAAALSKPTMAYGQNKMACEDWGKELRMLIPSRDRPSIAVLPCQTPANEPTLHWVAASVADAIAAALCSVRSLAVMVPRSLRAAMLDPQRLARELNARYFLTGRIVLDGSCLRVILCVVDSATPQCGTRSTMEIGRQTAARMNSMAIFTS